MGRSLPPQQLLMDRWFARPSLPSPPHSLSSHPTTNPTPPSLPTPHPPQATTIGNNASALPRPCMPASACAQRLPSLPPQSDHPPPYLSSGTPLVSALHTSPIRAVNTHPLGECSTASPRMNGGGGEHCPRASHKQPLVDQPCASSAEGLASRSAHKVYPPHAFEELLEGIDFDEWSPTPLVKTASRLAPVPPDDSAGTARLHSSSFGGGLELAAAGGPFPPTWGEDGALPVDTHEGADENARTQREGLDGHCTICFEASLLERSEADQLGEVDGCNHLFCFECIFRWCEECSRCPLCKRDVRCISRTNGKRAMEWREIAPKEQQKPEMTEEELRALEEEAEDVYNCRVCNCGDNEGTILLCDSCDSGYHMGCLTPRLYSVPEGDWYCPDCAPTLGSLGARREREEEISNGRAAERQPPRRGRQATRNRESARRSRQRQGTVPHSTDPSRGRAEPPATSSASGGWRQQPHRRGIDDARHRRYTQPASAPATSSRFFSESAQNRFGLPASALAARQFAAASRQFQPPRPAASQSSTFATSQEPAVVLSSDSVFQTQQPVRVTGRKRESPERDMRIAHARRPKMIISDSDSESDTDFR